MTPRFIVKCRNCQNLTKATLEVHIFTTRLRTISLHTYTDLVLLGKKKMKNKRRQYKITNRTTLLYEKKTSRRPHGARTKSPGTPMVSADNNLIKKKKMQ
jgi:hypothetical protein